MKKIVVIGAGNIGTRHVQALSTIDDLEVSIQVVDPFSEALIHAQSIVDGNEGRRVKKIDYFQSIDKLDNDLDLVIVATSSLVRRNIVEELLHKKNVNVLILEKVLFPKVEDYYAIDKLLKREGILTWVNCARRSWKFYQQFGEKLMNVGPVKMTISGKLWGLGCNTIHYLDLLTYLTGATEVPDIDISELDNVIISSKRNGYVEFTGSLKGKIGEHSFVLTSIEDSEPPFDITFTTDTAQYEIHERDSVGVVNTFIRDINGKWEIIDIESFTIPFQSKLTNIVAQEILCSGTCPLTSYTEAMRLHLPMINAFLSMININGYQTDICNIT